MAATKITVINNGPIRVEGDFELADPEGKTFGLGGKTTLYLCRCGLSENKPLCDGHHRQGGFAHEARAREL
jgi:CDGSH-type Zn-finger protein